MNCVSRSELAEIMGLRCFVNSYLDTTVANLDESLWSTGKNIDATGVGANVASGLVLPDDDGELFG